MTQKAASRLVSGFGVLLMSLFLAGCVALQPTAEIAETKTGGIAIVGPSGFCALEQTRLRQGDAEFLALAPCDRQLPLLGAAPEAILTVTLGEAGTANGLDMTGKGLSDYFTGAEGRKAMSRAGDAATVHVEEVREVNGAVIVRLTDRSARWQGMIWRAVMAVQGRLVTLTLRGKSANALTRAQGAQLMDRFAASMRRANQK